MINQYINCDLNCIWSHWSIGIIDQEVWSKWSIALKSHQLEIMPFNCDDTTSNGYKWLQCTITIHWHKLLMRVQWGWTLNSKPDWFLLLKLLHNCFFPIQQFSGWRKKLRTKQYASNWDCRHAHELSFCRPHCCQTKQQHAPMRTCPAAAHRRMEHGSTNFCESKVCKTFCCQNSVFVCKQCLQ